MKGLGGGSFQAVVGDLGSEFKVPGGWDCDPERFERPLDPLPGAGQLTSGAWAMQDELLQSLRANSLALKASDCKRCQKCLEAEIRRPDLQFFWDCMRRFARGCRQFGDRVAPVCV